jgi:molybdopterin molybdotransferase
MVSVEEATRIIQSIKIDLQTEDVDIGSVVGRVLAEEVLADRDFPPFHRVAMDGIAVKAVHIARNKELEIEEVQAAGVPAKKLTDPYKCIEVMTGAMLPVDTDAVIRYEDLEIQGNKAKVLIEQVQVGANIHPKAQDASQGDVLLSPGQRISAAEVALLASVGKSVVKVYSLPKTAVIASGDELVDVTVKPEPHQIRRSNTHALRAAMKIMGWEADPFYLVDNKAMIKETLQIILNDHDVLILSGGVSKGKFDFIPRALEELGFDKLFHQVGQRPGKPFWFGVKDNKKIVFAFPGNPVSTFLCFYRYARPWLQTCLGTPEETEEAILASDVSFQPELTYFLQVQIQNENGKWVAYPKPGGGSGDYANLRQVHGFLELPSNKTTFKKGESYPYIRFRD